jgi:hypothetical protein
MARVTYGPATAADLDAYYGGRNRQTLRAIVVKLDDVPMGVIALVRERDRYLMISESKPELEPHLKSMAALRAIKAAMAWVRETKVPVFAVCQDSERLLERLGFVHVQDGVYQWRS